MPVLRLLRRHHPTAVIHWWISSSLSGLLHEDPDLDGVIRFQRRGWFKPSQLLAGWQGLQRIRAFEFDWVIDLQSLLRSSVLGRLSGAGRFIGLTDWREGAPLFQQTSIPRPSPTTHAVDWYLRVLDVLQTPVSKDFEWIPKRPLVAESISRQVSGLSGPLIGLQPGARWMNKRWPVRHFRELAVQITRAIPSARLAVFGSADDSALSSEILIGMGPEHLNLTGKTTLPESIEWLRRCRVLVTNDTGPMHIAAALGTAVIGLFGPTNPLRTGPYGQIENVLQRSLPCAPCMRSRCHHSEPMACLEQLTPATVLQQVVLKVSAV